MMLPVKRSLQMGTAGDVLGRPSMGIIKRIRGAIRRQSLCTMLPWAVILLCSLYTLLMAPRRGSTLASQASHAYQEAIKSRGKILVSYSYFEKDQIQVRLCSCWLFMPGGLIDIASTTTTRMSSSQAGNLCVGLELQHVRSYDCTCVAFEWAQLSA